MTTDNDMQLRLTMPTRSIIDPKFRYVPSTKTDVKRTWRKFARLIRIQGARNAAL